MHSNAMKTFGPFGGAGKLRKTKVRRGTSRICRRRWSQIRLNVLGNAPAAQHISRVVRLMRALEWPFHDGNIICLLF